MKKIKILINMIFPCLLSLFLINSDTVKFAYDSLWPNILAVCAVIFFALFVCGFVAYVVTLVMDLVKFIKDKKGGK